MNVSFLQELLNVVAERGRTLLPWALGESEDIFELAQALISNRGEASGVAIAREILQLYRNETPEQRKAFFKFLAEGLVPDADAVTKAASAYLRAPDIHALARLQDAVESPRQEFFRRLNLSPGGTAEIVAMRRELLKLLKDNPELKVVDADLRHLLNSWFNRGFLVLKRIDWQTPAAILEKIIAYEAVHEIKGWDDLRRRLVPTDRRCFAFFHPSLVDEPLIFVEVALMADIPSGIDEVLGDAPVSDGAKPDEPTTAVFYSISNCQEGLKGISFGNFLIKQVVEDLVRELPSLDTFVTLSPVPGFARWLNRGLAQADPAIVTAADRVVLSGLETGAWIGNAEAETRIKAPMLALAAKYFLTEKADDGRPLDPVARFHLGNGARLERINWRGDLSAKGLKEAHGLMVNYLYDLKEIETNHEAFANEGRIAASRAVRSLLKVTPPPRRNAATALLEQVKPKTAEPADKAPDGTASPRQR